jgi:hypothetical protein
MPSGPPCRRPKTTSPDSAGRIGTLGSTTRTRPCKSWRCWRRTRSPLGASSSQPEGACAPLCRRSNRSRHAFGRRCAPWSPGRTPRGFLIIFCPPPGSPWSGYALPRPTSATSCATPTAVCPRAKGVSGTPSGSLSRDRRLQGWRASRHVADRRSASPWMANDSTSRARAIRAERPKLRSRVKLVVCFAPIHRPRRSVRRGSSPAGT